MNGVIYETGDSCMDSVLHKARKLKGFRNTNQRLPFSQIIIKHIYVNDMKSIEKFCSINFLY